jgi:hypothetical protein
MMRLLWRWARRPAWFGLLGATLAIFAAAAPAASAASAASGAPARPAATQAGWVRCAHLSPNAPAVDVYMYPFG